MANLWSVLFVSYFPAHTPVVSKELVRVGTKLGPGRDQVTAQVLNFCREPHKSSEIMELNGKSAILQKKCHTATRISERSRL